MLGVMAIVRFHDDLIQHVTIPGVGVRLPCDQSLSILQTAFHACCGDSTHCLHMCWTLESMPQRGLTWSLKVCVCGVPFV